MEPVILAPHNIGDKNWNGQVIIKGTCVFCNDSATFRQIGQSYSNTKIGNSVAIKCEGCDALQIFSISQKKIYPLSIIKGLEDLPEEINKYYQEALRCISYNCPNGAMTLFRKLIHQLGIHYNVATKNDNKSLYEIINKLHEEEHITEKLRKALLEVKDFGNDGAHVNDNEPTIEQALSIKSLIDSVLSTSIFVDETINKLEEIKSNE